MAERPLIVTTILPVTVFDTIPVMKCLRDDFDVLFWKDFIENPEPYLEKVIVIQEAVLSPEKISEELLRRMTNLRAVIATGVGVNQLDIPLLRKYGIKIARVAGSVTADSVADLGFGLMVAAARRIPEVSEAARGYEEGATKLNLKKNQALIAQDIHHATLGIVGMGHIGFEVARRAQGFKMKVLYHHRHKREDDVEVNATFCPTAESLLPVVDYLMIAVPLTETTKNMLGRDQFQMMKATSIIVNIARGPVINTNDLVEALRSGTLGGAALDVTDPEPLPDQHPLLHMPNVIVTPHMGMFTHGGLDGIFAVSAENTRAAIEGRQMPGELVDSTEGAIIM